MNIGVLEFWNAGVLGKNAEKDPIKTQF